MICNNCKANNPDGASFCQYCGAKLTEDTQPQTMPVQEQSQPTQTPVPESTPFAQPQPTAEPMSMPIPEPAPMTSKPESGFKALITSKKFIIGAACALVAIIAAVVLLVAFSSSSGDSGKYLKAENSIEVFYSPDNDETSVMYNGKLLFGTIDGEAYIEAKSSSVDSALLLSDDDTLYFVNKSGIKEIAEDVYEAILSYNGNVIVYTDDDDALYTLKSSGGKPEYIADDVDHYSISPDGKSILYVSDYETYIKTGSKIEAINEDYEGGYISDGAKYIVARDYDRDSLGWYNFKNGFTELIDGDDIYRCVLNNNNTELLIENYDDKTYISINGGDLERIGKYTYIVPLLPYDSTYLHSTASAATTFIDIPMVYFDDDGCYCIGYIDKNYEMQEIAEDINDDRSDIAITSDLSTIFYIVDDELYRAKKSNKYKPEKLADDVYSFEISKDGKTIYFENYDDELYCLNGKNEVFIAEEIYSYGLSDSGVAFFLADYYDGEGTLYRCSNGKNKELVARDVCEYELRRNCVLYYTDFEFTYDYYYETYTNYHYDVYVSTNDKDFTLLIEDVEIP